MVDGISDQDVNEVKSARSKYRLGFLISKSAGEAIWRSKVLTGSVSWDFESPCLLDHFEVAAWGGGAFLEDNCQPRKIAASQNLFRLI